MSELNEQQEWDGLLKSPAWAWFVAHARREWHDGYPMKVKLAITKAREAGSNIEAAVAAVDAANDAINALLTYPLEQVRKKAPVAPLKLNRGGL